MFKLLFLGLGLSVLAHSATVIEAQRDEPSVGTEVDNGQPPRPRFMDMFRNIMSVNVPAAFNMVKDGNSMGIDVLSGLVKVERGDEAVRSGLMGPRPLSVRVFGVPVYERGTRVRNPGSELQPPRPQRPFPEGGRGPEPEAEPAGDEDLPVIPA